MMRTRFPIQRTAAQAWQEHFDDVAVLTLPTDERMRQASVFHVLIGRKIPSMKMRVPGNTEATSTMRSRIAGVTASRRSIEIVSSH